MVQPRPLFYFFFMPGSFLPWLLSFIFSFLCYTHSLSFSSSQSHSPLSLTPSTTTHASPLSTTTESLPSTFFPLCVPLSHISFTLPLDSLSLHRGCFLLQGTPIFTLPKPPITTVVSHSVSLYLVSPFLKVNKHRLSLFWC